MAERVGHFLWEDQTDEDSRLSELDEDDQNDRDSRLFKLLLKIVPTELEEEIELVRQDLEFIRSFFVDAEQGLYKDIWARVLDVAYEAKDVIDSIIVRDNGLLHLIFSLPITIKKIKLIKEEISALDENIPKDRGLIVVNSPKKPVERKSLTTDKIIVGFEEETNLILRKLTSGPADLDVISITGMPGSVTGNG
uniref:Rx N-terminal domain-containing protein n=1 Tax=Solanum lycopersicum TaxID=4081 RepID=A0A3Q7GPP9_SOLLC